MRAGYERRMASVDERQAVSRPASAATVGEGMVVGGRYRIVAHILHGWLAYDERLTRSVLLDPISGDRPPDERIRRAVSTEPGLLDALVIGSEAFVVRTTQET
jgi:hypothetical protein